MKRVVPFLALVCASVATAQAPNAPPKVISLYREEVKPSRNIQHGVLEAALAKHWAKFGVQPYLALNAVTGAASDVLFISSYPGWSDVDKDFAAFDKGSAAPEFAAMARQEAELVSSVKASLAAYREDLSYQPAKFMEQLPRSRWVWMRTIRVKPGHEASFVESAKMNVKAHADAKMEESWVVYQVAAGAQNGTFLAFQVQRALAEEEGVEPAHKAMREAAGAEWVAKMAKHAEDDVAFDQWDVWGISPRMSHVSKEFAAADAAFWTPKPEAAPAAKKATAKKEEKKP